MPEEEVTQPVVEETASAVVEDASPEPAPVDEGAPAETQDEQPSDELTDADWDAIYEKYPDRDPRKVAEATRKEAQTPEAIKKNDRFLGLVQQQANDAYQYIAQAQQKLSNGEFPDDPEALTAALDATGDWQSAAERRGQLSVNRFLFEREVLGIEDGKLDESKELHKQYADLLTELETAQDNAFRIRGSARREYDPDKRQKLLLRSSIDDATASGEFYRKTLQFTLARGKELGAESAGKRISEAAEKGRKAGNTEAIAKARAAIAGGTAMSTAGNSRPSTDITYQQLLQLKPADQSAWIASNPKKYDAMIGIKS